MSSSIFAQNGVESYLEGSRVHVENRDELVGAAGCAVLSVMIIGRGNCFVVGLSRRRFPDPGSAITLRAEAWQHQGDVSVVLPDRVDPGGHLGLELDVEVREDDVGRVQHLP